MTTHHFVLVPGYWLGSWAWDRVAAPLRAAGHRVAAVTLPGVECGATDRSSISLSDHVDAVAAIVSEAVTAGDDAGVILVAHSGAGKIVSGVLDRDPGSIRRMIYVDSGPSRPGDAEELAAELSELPLPTWEEFAERGSSLEGLTPEDLAEFVARAVPHPAGPIREPLPLRHDDARRAVPTTIIACSIRSTMVQELAAGGHPMFAEVARLADVAYVDLPTGHWPMWSRPDDLAAALMRTVAADAAVAETTGVS